MTDNIVDYFHQNDTEPLPSLTRLEWLEARFTMLAREWRCTEDELADVARRWLAAREEE